MKLFIITAIAGIAIGCGNAASPIAQNSNAVPASSSPEKQQTAIAHSLENQTPNPNAPANPGASTGGKSKWTQSGDPIDTKEFDTTIASAEVALKKSPNDGAIKKKLADAYFARGIALTQPARQYASALGDFRRAVKFDPSNTQAKDWINQIITIYDSINREYPKEGEEPPSLPFNKAK